MIDRQSPSEEGFCARCGYSLHGLPKPRCPECGHPFDPNDPRTFLIASQKRWLGRISQRLCRPLGKVFHIFAILCVLLALFAAAMPVPTLFLLIGFWGCVVAFTIWFLRVLGFGAARLVCWTLAVRPKPSRGWLVPPLMLSATVVLCWFNVPFYAGLILSKPGLDRLVADAAAAPPYHRMPSRMVGLYPATRIIPMLGGVRFDVLGCPGGLAYLPKGPPASGDHRYTRVWGDWYIFEREWGVSFPEIIWLERPRDG